MRVALILPTERDPAHRRVASELGRALRARRHRVTPFFGEGGSRGELRRALRRVFDRGVDVCHIQFFSRGLSFLEELSIPDRIRVVLTHQGADPALLEHPGIFASLARRADAVTAVSARGLADLARRFPAIRKKASVVFNGVDLNAWPPRNAAATPFILSVGRLAAYKGIDLLLLAFSGLAVRHPRLTLWLCGPDQTKGRLASYAARLGIKDRVRFLGLTSPARVRRLLSKCMLFVQPSRRENMPMALLEAMAAGAPILAAAAGGVPEVLRQGVNGLLVPPGNSRALERALDLLVADAPLKARLGRAARRGARRFSWDRIAAGYERVYLTRGQLAPVGQSRTRFSHDSRTR